MIGKGENPKSGDTMDQLKHPSQTLTHLAAYVAFLLFQEKKSIKCLYTPYLLPYCTAYKSFFQIL